MITPKELLEKSIRPFNRIVSSQLRGDNIFPWIVPSNKRISGSNYSEWKNDLVPLFQQSKESQGIGYSIEWKQKIINGSKQSVPAKIFFETFEDYLAFSGKNRDYNRIKKAWVILVDEFPVLSEWAINNPGLLLVYHDAWNGIMQVCKFMISHPPPHNFYVRELPVPVHSKFIEDHASILKKILDIILPIGWVRTGEKDFALRYGFKVPHVHTQIRILDEELKPVLGYEECSLPLDDAAWLKWIPEKVFIIENQICYLTFPKVKNAVAIFGEGFKSRLSRHIPWLEQTTLFCWFDLDASGFEMLNMVRTYYPNAKSFLMDKKTFETFAQFNVENMHKKRVLPNLSLDENLLYQFLTTNNKRLEQERIVQKYVLDSLLLNI